MNPQPTQLDLNPTPAATLSFWERFVATAKIVAKHISPMDGRHLPFDDRANHPR